MLLAGSPEFLLFCLVLMRISGAILLNPIFGRNTIPSVFKAGLILAFTVLVYPTVAFEAVEVTSSLQFGVLLLKEFLVGFTIGVVIQIFEMVPVYAGAIIDFQMGLSMASFYDAQSGIQMPLSGNILQIYFMLLFFAVDGHLAFLQIIGFSQLAVPYAQVAIGQEVANAVVSMFVIAVGLAVRLAFPLIAIEFLTEVGIAILMKIIPQINLFVMSIQLRVLVGLLVMTFYVSPAGAFLNEVITEMIDSIQEVLTLSAA